MTQTRTSGPPKRGWRAWLGLQAPPRGPEDWIRVASYYAEDEHGSKAAARAARTLGDAGIDARQQPYVLPDQGAMRPPGPLSAVERLRVAVFVRRCDWRRAADVLREPEPEPISDEELTRLSLEASASPEEPSAADR